LVVAKEGDDDDEAGESVVESSVIGRDLERLWEMGPGFWFA
tara:strand:+ start:792 stop:914 length:123 start_codon:yes stop_codon:yes gene_type:complete